MSMLTDSMVFLEGFPNRDKTRIKIIFRNQDKTTTRDKTRTRTKPWAGGRYTLQFSPLELPPSVAPQPAPVFKGGNPAPAPVSVPASDPAPTPAPIPYLTMARLGAPATGELCTPPSSTRGDTASLCSSLTAATVVAPASSHPSCSFSSIFSKYFMICRLM